jgi:hypothetical protein
MDVRGDQYLRFTLEEAAAWLGEREAQHRADADEDPAGVGWYVVGVLGAAAICIVLVMTGTMIYAILYGLAHPQIASNVTQSSIQSRRVPAHVIRRAGFHRPEAISPHAPTVRYLPHGWFYGRMKEELPLRDRAGKSHGALPAGATFFGIAGASQSQLIVAANGSLWGYGELEPSGDIPDPPIAIRPEFEKAASLIAEIEASGIAEDLRRKITQPEPLEDVNLPAGWTAGCLIHDEPLTYGVYGIKIGTVRKGTCLLYEITSMEGWRLVISPDGSYRGYAHFEPLYGATKRTRMRPDYRGAVNLIHRLENGLGSEGLEEMRQAFIQNAPTPVGGEGTLNR